MRLLLQDIFRFLYGLFGKQRVAAYFADHCGHVLNDNAPARTLEGKNDNSVSVAAFAQVTFHG